MATHRRSWKVVAVAAALGAALTACEGAVELNATKLTGPDATVSQELKDLARAHSQDMCEASVVAPTPDPEAAYGPDTYELVDAEPLDPGLDPPTDNHQATRAIWQRWRIDPVLNTGTWDLLGAGEVECDDGKLYLTLVLHGSPEGPPVVDGVERLTQGSASSRLGGITADGDLVALNSLATDLVPGGNDPDMFIYDATADTLTPSGHGPGSLSLSADGNLAVFSAANPLSNIYLWDRAEDTVESLTGCTEPGSPLCQVYGDPTLSPDGGYFTYRIEGGGGPTFRFHDRATGAEAILGGDVGSWQFTISNGGRYVASLGYEVRMTDTTTRETTVLSHGSSGCWSDSIGPGSAMSGDGRFVAYTCYDQDTHPGDADDRPDLFMWDRTTGDSVQLTSGADGLGTVGNPSVSDDGRFVAYAYERPTGGSGTHLLDRASGTVSLLATVAARQVTLSDDGSAVAFSAGTPERPGLVDIYRWEIPAA